MQTLELGEKRLMNFRVSDKVKTSFHKVCRYNGSNMTNELIRLMRTYIDHEGTKILQEQHNVEEILNLIPKHINPSRKTTSNDYWYEDKETTDIPPHRHGEWILGNDKTWRNDK